MTMKVDLKMIVIERVGINRINELIRSIWFTNNYYLWRCIQNIYETLIVNLKHPLSFWRFIEG